MRPTFDHTVNILVKAYLNDTLTSRHPCGCAGGNIIAASKGYRILAVPLSRKAEWVGENVEDGFDWFAAVMGGFDKGDIENGKKQIEGTGYTVDEFARIEEAFERAYFESSLQVTQETIFTGLMYVVDTLAKIHGVDLNQKESAKQLFVK